MKGDMRDKLHTYIEAFCDCKCKCETCNPEQNNCDCYKLLEGRMTLLGEEVKLIDITKIIDIKGEFKI